MVTIECHGDFGKTEKYLKKLVDSEYFQILQKFGEMGVEALSAATPVDTGKTSQSWYYEIETGSDHVSLNWMNTNVNNGVNIAVIIQYGHGTGTGGYVQGVDYINPALRSVFDNISTELSRELSSL